MTHRQVWVEGYSFPTGRFNLKTGSWSAYHPMLRICIEPPLPEGTVPAASSLSYTPDGRVTPDIYACLFSGVVNDPTTTQLEATTTAQVELGQDQFTLAALRSLIASVRPHCEPDATFTIVDTWSK